MFGLKSLLAVLCFTLVSGEISPGGNSQELFLEETCQQYKELIVNENIVTVRLRRPTPTKESTPKCGSHITISSVKNQSLLLTVQKLNLSQKDNGGICLSHFLQIDGLTEKRQSVRLCGDHSKTGSQEQLLLDANAEKFFYYTRNVPIENDSDLNITIAPVSFATVNGDCDQSDTAESFKCQSDNLCLPKALRCDSTPNCADGSDELECLSTTTTTTTTTNKPFVASRNPSDVLKSDSNRDQSINAWDSSAVRPDLGKNKIPFVIAAVLGGLFIVAVVAGLVLLLMRKRGHRFQAVPTTQSPPERQMTTAAGAEQESIDTTQRV